MARISLAEMVETLKATAIANALTPNEESVYRHFCRKYSVAFNTPLIEVLELHPEHVLLNVFEHQLDAMDLDENLEELLQMIYQIEDPSYDVKAEEELAEFAAMAEEEERLRVRDKRRIGFDKKKEKAVVKEEKPEEELPESGGINFDYLSNSDNER